MSGSSVGATGRRIATSGRPISPKWVGVTGVVSGVMTLLFFMGLALASIFKHEVPAGSRFLVLAVLSFGAAMSVGFVSGAAAAKGKIPLPAPFNNVIAVSTSGGIAVLVILLLLGYHLYVKPDAPVRSNLVLALPAGTPREFTIENLSPEAIYDAGEVRTIGNKQLLYVEFVAGKSAGDLRITSLKNSGSGFESVIYEISKDGSIIKRSGNR